MQTEIEKSPEYIQAVDQIRAKFNNWVDAGIELFMALRELELSEVWCELHKDFEAFLRSEFPNMLGIVRYRHVIDALEQHGEEMVRKVGVLNCHALLSKRFDEQPEKKAVLSVVINDYIERHGGTPDAEYITKQRKALLGEVSLTKDIMGLSRTAQLQQEIKRLKTELRQAHAEIRALKKQLTKAA